MSLRNPYGDFEITDPQAMRGVGASRSPRRAQLSAEERTGHRHPVVVHVGASPSVTSWHLRHLESFGWSATPLPRTAAPTSGQRWWKSAARGFRFRMPETPEGAEAGRMLRTEMRARRRPRPAMALRHRTGPRPRLESVDRLVEHAADDHPRRGRGDRERDRGSARPLCPAWRVRRTRRCPPGPPDPHGVARGN